MMSVGNNRARKPLSADKINKVLIEELINNLKKDKEIDRIRTATVEYVKRKLLENMHKPLADILKHASELNGAELRRFAEEIAKEINLSQVKLREFKLRVKDNDNTEAISFLKKILINREMIRFHESIGIRTKVWKDFENSRRYTAEVTLQKIRKGLKLTEDEIKEFDKTVVADVFEVNDQLKRKVHELHKNTGMSVTDFLIYSYVSSDAWEAFCPAPKPDSDGEEEIIPDNSPERKPKKTSQNTLLKLIIGYGIDEQEAKTFLALVNRSFITEVDLIFLAAICCGYRHPIEMQEILEFFLKDPSKNPYLRSL